MCSTRLQMSNESYYRRSVSMSLTQLNACEDDGSESGMPSAIEFDADFEVFRDSLYQSNCCETNLRSNVAQSYYSLTFLGEKRNIKVITNLRREPSVIE